MFDPREMADLLAEMQTEIEELKTRNREMQLTFSRSSLPANSSFPTSAPAGAEQTRSDTLTKHIYNGSVWLDPTPTPLPFVPFTAFSLPVAAAGGSFAYVCANPPNGCIIYDFRAVTSVATTNNASNYWGVTLSAGGTTIASFTTATDTVGTTTQHTPTLNNTTIAAATTSIQVQVTPSGSPGAITFYQVVSAQRIFV